MNYKKAHRRTMGKNLMFSQRNNPYCDLLQLVFCKNTQKKRESQMFLKNILVDLGI